MKKQILLFLLIFLILPLSNQRKVEDYKQSEDEHKRASWSNGQLAEFQKELALIQKNDKHYDWREDARYKLDEPKGSTLIKPDLVPPGSIVISDLGYDESLKQDPQFLPNAIQGENPPIFIPIKPLTSNLKWLNFLSRGD